MRLGDVQIDSIPSHIALSPDATRLLTVADNTLTIWDVGSLDAVARIRTQTGFVLTPAISIDGQYIAIAEQLDADNVLYSLLRAVDGELVSSVEWLTGVREWVLGPQARYLVLVGPSRSVRLMDPRRGEIVMELPHRRDPLRLVSTTDDLLLSVDSAGDIRVWRLADTQRGGPNGQLAGVTSDPQSVSLSGNGAAIAYEVAHGHVVVRDLADDAVKLIARVHRSGAPLRTRLSPGARQLVTGSGPMLRVWDIPAGTGAPPSHPGVSAMALDEAAQIAALGYRDGHLRIRTTAQLVEGLDAPDTIEYIGHQDMVTSITVNSARGLIASGGRDGTVRIWELASGAPTAPFMRHAEGPIRQVALSDDGRWVVSTAEGSARVWGTESGNLAQEIAVNGTGLATTVSPDSATVAVGDSAGNLFITDIEGRSAPRTARAQAGVTALAFTANGQRLASGDRSGRIQLWQVSDARAISSAVVLSHPVRWLNFDDDGNYLIAQTEHWVHRLEIVPNGLRVVASRLVGVDLAAGAPLAPNGESIRLIGGRDLGSVYVDEVSWQADEVGTKTLDAAQLGRSWPEILGLRVDAAADVVDVRR
jgi:WD40 repeat protein